MLSMKNLLVEVISAKPKIIGFAALLLLFLFLIFVFGTYRHNKAIEEPADAATDAQIENTESMMEAAVLETQPVGIPATMGTITTDNLSICKDPGFVIDIDAYYVKGDRVEIQETTEVNSRTWGYTGKGWVDMACVRMDDVPPQGGNFTNSDGIEIVSNGSHTILGYGVVDIGTLNVRIGPGTNYTKIKEIVQGSRHAYYEVSDEWVRIGDGWVSTSYFYLEGTIAEDSTAATVTADDLNVRSGPDTSFKRINNYSKDDSVQLFAVVNGWAYTEKGWISMIYVQLPEPVYATGRAIVTVGLNIREEPDPASAKIDAYQEGETVSIIEVKDGWGKTDKGWINLDYVKYD